jgi:hypothetical protein
VAADSSAAVGSQVDAAFPAVRLAASTAEVAVDFTAPHAAASTEVAAGSTAVVDTAVVDMAAADTGNPD